MYVACSPYVIHKKEKVDDKNDRQTRHFLNPIYVLFYSYYTTILLNYACVRRLGSAGPQGGPDPHHWRSVPQP